MNGRKISAVALTLALVFSLIPSGATSAAANPASGHSIQVTSRGTTVFTVPSSAAQEVIGNVPDTLRNQIGNSTEHELRQNSELQANARPVPVLPVPTPAPNPVNAKPSDDLVGWKGLIHYETRLANGGNQYSTEPPDQGLCVGGGYVVEAVNDILAVYDTKGTVKKDVTDLNTFFQYPAAIDRTNLVYGPTLTDPKCLYDQQTGRWFLTVLTLNTDSASGDFTGTTHVDIAVSKSSNPTGSWLLYSLDTTNGSGTLPGHIGCPCLGDQPLIGLDKYSFVITTNEFPVFGSGFNGAQVYALSKSALLNGDPFNAVGFDQLDLEEGPAYTLQPANPGSGVAPVTAGGGTEYFLSALDFNAQLDNRIALWALTGTSTLNTASPKLSLNYTILTSEVYGQPPNAYQKDGPRPLGESLGEKLSQINANDDRMNQVSYAAGKLYSAVNTVVHVKGKASAGIAYFVVTPSLVDGKPSGSIADQGYVAVKDNNVMFPAVSATSSGNALMTFTLVGPDYYPSAAYARLAPNATVRVAGVGTEPADGFSAYVKYSGNGIERWGDYSAAVSDGNSVWMATEYIPGGPRTTLANWGTFVFRIKP